MRRNNRTRPSSLVQNYDVIYDFLPDQPHVSRIINHPRKLIIINRSADPYYSRPREIPHERTPHRCPVARMAADTERGI